jgi:pimeloyl-ACP methyl ester carboxylesterase
MMKTFSYFQDQELAYLEAGDPHGAAILVQHGMIASITGFSIFQRLIDAGKRVICAARPGYGDSSPYDMPAIGTWGEINAALVKELGLARVDVLGISSGAPYAYAVAAKLPKQVRSVFILSGMPAFYDAQVQALWPHPLNQQASIEEMKAVAQEVFFAQLSPADREMPDFRDSLRHDGFGPALDLKIRARDWGFTLMDVHAPVYMRHSREDMPSLAERTAALLPNVMLELRENDPHFSPEALDRFIAEVILPVMDEKAAPRITL